MSATTITRLPTSPRPRAVDEPMPEHVRHAADANVARLNAKQHPNAVRMHDAMDRWTKESNKRGGQAGIEYLARCAAQVEANWNEFQSAVAEDRPFAFTGLEGLTVGDFDAITLRMDRQVRRLSGEAV